MPRLAQKRKPGAPADTNRSLHRNRKSHALDQVIPAGGIDCYGVASGRDCVARVEEAVVRPAIQLFSYLHAIDPDFDFPTGGLIGRANAE